MKRNIIREIIADFYDLDGEQRNRALLETERFVKNWKAKKGRFPSEKIRDMVRIFRNPEHEKLRAEVAKRKGKLDLPSGVTLDIPPHFESDRLTMNIEFRSATELSEKLEKLLSKGTENRIRSLLELL